MKIALATLGALGLAASTNAAITGSLSDAASLQGSLIGAQLEDFNQPDVDFNPPATADFNGFSVSTADSSSFANDFAIVDNELSLFIDDGNIQSFTFDFDGPIDTFGAAFAFANPVPGLGLIFSFNNGEVFELNSDTVAGYDGNLYVALSSSTAFTSFTITSANGIDGFDIDDVVTGLVPSPGAASLLALAGLAAARRRRA